MKIVLFYPRNFDNRNKKTDIASLAVTLPPLGLMSIAAVLKKNGHDVWIFDAAGNYTLTDDIWIERIISKKPDFVGFSAITPSFWNAYDICKAIKSRNSTIRTIFGGVQVSWGRDQILKKCNDIDYIVAGEGEQAFSRLINGDKKSSIPGLYYRENGICNSGPDQTRKDLVNMDDLPFPAYDLIEGFPKRYNMALFSYPKSPTASIISSRGCIYRCSYCDRSVFHQSFRWNSPEYTFELIRMLNQDYGVRHVMFYDDLFTLNRKRVSRLCSLLRASRMKITFNCIVRIGHIDKDLIKELKSAGCWLVHVGVESGDQDILDKHKELDLITIRNDVEELHKSGLYVKGLFMMGFPGETEVSINKTIEFASSLPLKDANLTAFTPYPGAPISKNIHEFGAFDDSWENWQNLDCTKFVFIPDGIESKEYLENRYREFLSTFYNRPFIRKIYRNMFLESSHSYWRLLKAAPTFFNFIRSMK